MTKYVVDIETDGLLDKVSKIHCIVAIDTETKKVLKFHNDLIIERDGDISQGLTELSNAELLVFHNGIGYDIPAIKKLHPEFTHNKLHDTYILSQMFFPNEMERHSVDAWGKVFGRAKPKHEDWSTFSEEMLHRCIEDTKITKMLWDKCENELGSWDWDAAVRLEYKVYEIFSKNQTHWYIDTFKLRIYIKYLSKVVSICEVRLNNLAPKKVSHSKTITKAFTKAGSISAITERFCLKHGLSPVSIAGDFCQVSFEEMNIASPKQVTDWLLSIGWRPDTFNYKKNAFGKPIKSSNGDLIITSPSLRDSSFFGIKGDVQKYLKLRAKASHRLNVLLGWERSLFEDNKIQTFAYTCGTNTARFKHRGVANVPKAEEEVFFGKQMRSLFIAPKGYKVVGCDASQLEARIEGHATFKYDGGNYAKFLLEEDIHQFNANSWGISRSEAKSPGYALAYQCGPNKIKDLLGCTDERAKEIHQKYWDDRPAMSALIEALEDSVVARNQATRNKYKGTKLRDGVKAWVRGIDGRKLYVRSTHSLKNTYIQNAGMVAVKIAYCFLDKGIKDSGLDARIVMLYHDEYEILVKDNQKEIEILKHIAEESINKAGKYLKLNVELTGVAKVGNNWGEVH